MVARLLALVMAVIPESTEGEETGSQAEEGHLQGVAELLES